VRQGRQMRDILLAARPSACAASSLPIAFGIERGSLPSVSPEECAESGAVPLVAAGQEKTALSLKDDDECAGDDVNLVLGASSGVGSRWLHFRASWATRACAFRSALRPMSLRAASSFSEEVAG